MNIYKDEILFLLKGVFIGLENLESFIDGINGAIGFINLKNLNNILL